MNSYYAVMISFLRSGGEVLPSDEDNEVAAVSERPAVASLYLLCLSGCQLTVIASPES